MTNVFDSMAVGLPMMLFTIIGVLAAILVVAYALRTGRRDLLKKTGMAAALWVGIYVILLLLASFSSRERTLPIGERLAFCGFYIDCHLGVRVDSTWEAPILRTTSQVYRPGGEYYVSWLRFDSDAVAVPLRLNEPRFVAVGASGQRIECDMDISRQVMRDAGLSTELSRTIQPRGGSYTVACVFDVPADQVPPRLLVRKGGRAERLSELFLIGDTDSAFHAPVYLALTP